MKEKGYGKEGNAYKINGTEEMLYVNEKMLLSTVMAIVLVVANLEEVDGAADVAIEAIARALYEQLGTTDNVNEAPADDA
jgi:hypothetical protein